jgi:predicted amidohydrolase
MADVFIADADDVDSYLESWSNIAENYEVAVIAGSCFAASEHGRLRNRSFVFDSEGSQIYYQDKVFLTEFESGIIGLEAGYIEDASFFKIAGKNIVMTICRDSYAREWEHKNSGAFLWVDIKANGEVFNTAQRQSFLRALPSRLFYSDVNYGMTVCAVGKYLDLFWEGESSALQKRDDGLYLVAAAASFDQDDTVVFKISRGQ